MKTICVGEMIDRVFARAYKISVSSAFYQLYHRRVVKPSRDVAASNSRLGPFSVVTCSTNFRHQPEISQCASIGYLRTLRIPQCGRDFDERDTADIIGVAEDVRSFVPEIEPGPMVYVPAAATATWNPMQLFVRTRVEPTAQTPAVRAALRATDLLGCLTQSFAKKIALPLEVFTTFYALIVGSNQNLPPPYFYRSDD